MSLYLGPTPIANTGYDKANTDLSNLTDTGKNIANWSSNVTNCITDIPQDIKLELNNGTLTLKAGSKVYVPNGVGVFTAVTIASDLTATLAFNGTVVCYLINTSTTPSIAVADLSSSTGSGTGTGNGLYYSTDNNRMYVNGSDISASFPFAIAINNGTQFTSIDKVFNGFGYIGSTVFALPNVKGLIPNGRNADGSLKNIEFETSGVKTFNAYVSDTLSRAVVFELSSGELVTPTFASGYVTNPVWGHYKIQEEKPTLVAEHQLWLNTTDNKYYAKSSTDADFIQYPLICVGYLGGDDSSIETFNVNNKVFHALDWGDSPTISGWSMPSSRYIDLTLGATGATYIAQANGCFVLDKRGTGQGQYLYGYNQTSRWRVCTNTTNNGAEAFIFIPCKRGEICEIQYTAGGAVECFRFHYFEGEN